MELYQGTHGAHILAYRDRIAQTVSNAINQFPRTMILRVDLHYPPILDNGDTVCCLPNLAPGAISRFLDSLKAILEAYEYRRKVAGIRIHYNVVRNIWAREYSQSGKCHFHICLFFNKNAYYHLGHLNHPGTLSNMIIRAWYSALSLEIEDCRDLVHFPDNCKYILDIKDPDFDIIYNDLINRLDYLTKIDTKVFGEGDRNFGCSRR
ncbi:inovirus Gp2 family protein [Yersinia enterocolitica]|nr:inovirus Gp2 family protein [Yersinia enterocolitica]